VPSPEAAGRSSIEAVRCRLARGPRAPARGNARRTSCGWRTPACQKVRAGDVLARVHAAALNPADWHILRGNPLDARLMGAGLTRAEGPQVAGLDAAGVAEAAGRERARGCGTATRCSAPAPQGAFAEYACAAADIVVPKSASLTFEQAAAGCAACATPRAGALDRPAAHVAA